MGGGPVPLFVLGSCPRAVTQYSLRTEVCRFAGLQTLSRMPMAPLLQAPRGRRLRHVHTREHVCVSPRAVWPLSARVSRQPPCSPQWGSCHHAPCRAFGGLLRLAACLLWSRCVLGRTAKSWWRMAPSRMASMGRSRPSLPRWLPMPNSLAISLPLNRHNLKAMYPKESSC